MKNQPEWWDPYSCQPYKMADQDKPRSGLANIIEYSKVAASNLLGLPAISYQYLKLKPKPAEIPADQFIGLSISPDHNYQNALLEMVDELGVKQLLLRIPSWDLNAIDDYVKFLESFPKHEFVINVLQRVETV